MVAVRLEGRLGNQLFQYAFIYATAKKLNTSFYIDKSLGYFILPKYFNLNNGGRQMPRRLTRLFYSWLQKLVFGNKVIDIAGEAPVEQALSQIKDGYMYLGFFQSELYFESAKTDLRTLFGIKKIYTDEFAQLAQKISSPKKMIAVHIRRGDYVNLDLALPVSYYKHALEAAAYQDAFCVFISDDPAFIDAEFGYVANKYVSNNPEIIDLQFLINADVCILSNSSFSWWGAWLNTNAGKVVYAPKNWLNFDKDTEYPAGILDNLNYNIVPAHS